MNITVLDFETYFDTNFSLKKLTIPEYVHDPRFHVHGLAISWPEGNTEFRVDVPDALAQLQARFGKDLEGTTIACHNAHFDLFILNHRYNIRPRFFIDTLALAHHVHGRRDGTNGSGASLAALAERYHLPHKGDLDFMCGIRNPDATQQADLAEYARRDAEITALLADRLLPQISRPEVEIPIMMHTTRLFTERGVRVDVAGIARLEKEVRDRTQEALAAAGVEPDNVSKDKQFTKLLGAALARTGRKVPLKMGSKKGLIPATAKNDQAMQALLDDDDPVVAALAHARLEKKGQDQKLARLETLRQIAKATGGVLPAFLTYYGAHTGRFAGGDGFNIQNQGRSGIGAKIRNLLVTAPGQIFIIGDLSQIEARVTAWCADEVDMLEAFGQNRDLYSEFASQTLGRDVHKPTDVDPPEVREALTALRQVGKQAVLGLGFGMGALKFMNTLRADPKSAALFNTGELTPLICRDIVQTFRSTYSSIKQFWSDLENAAKQSIDGIETEVGRLRVGRQDDTTLIWLPSGRALRYPGLRLDNAGRSIRFLDQNGEEGEFTPEGPSMIYGKGVTIYGGKLTENVVQAAARDLLVEAMLRIEQVGLSVAFHVHDEVVVSVAEAAGDQARVILEEELNRVPAWADGLPIACEVKTAARYGK